MPLRRWNRRTTPITPTQTPLPPPQFNLAALQEAIDAAVTVALAHLSESGTNGSDSGTYLTNPGVTYGHPLECSYKDFMNCKTQIL